MCHHLCSPLRNQDHFREDDLTLSAETSVLSTSKVPPPRVRSLPMTQGSSELPPPTSNPVPPPTSPVPVDEAGCDGDDDNINIDATGDAG